MMQTRLCAPTHDVGESHGKRRDVRDSSLWFLQLEIEIHHELGAISVC